MRCSLWCACAGGSFDVKIETDSNDAVKVKTEADISEYPHCDRPSTGTFNDFICD